MERDSRANDGRRFPKFRFIIETITIEIASPSITFLERRVDIFLFVLHQVFQRSPYENRVFGDIPAKEIGD
ncbi:hypothetical protein PNH38_06425 [Anoxybacillus rupiensis]|uniref:Uncharacterized protein n=1 Tax=Anoxybacteroides rupiense TaxID=311460 RepID=A0ABD5IZT6_9BACL|nr:MULTISPECIES: hypothetical protein [Anoxybacillus]MBB3908403.1 hypothetical protein [Anoxybacillus rupiensis]MDE8563524.1 hypothetical protein [Anoxybacillus rupiensis]MED5052861.1 hypothetical protein [Anoxybacillus rupiensis]QHC04320.1 hypothetical protein GRQ40_10360 [Anoxybacillus sp. PDR2]